MMAGRLADKRALVTAAAQGIGRATPRTPNGWRGFGASTINRKGLRAVLREIAYSADRSALFWWMVEHHDELAHAAQGRRLRWKPLCERFAALGPGWK
jgi:hypothetical protein